MTVFESYTQLTGTRALHLFLNIGALSEREAAAQRRLNATLQKCAQASSLSLPPPTKGADQSWYHTNARIITSPRTFQNVAKSAIFNPSVFRGPC